MKDGNFDIYVQHVDGSEAVARVEEPGDQTNPRWSPDGRYLAYVSTAEPGTPIFLVPPDGGTPRKLIESGLPTLSLGGAGLGVRPWSPDSRFLLVARALGNGRFGIDRVDVATGEATPFTRPPAGASDTSASYSFDGSRVLLRRGGFQSGTMMTVPAGGGEPQPLSDVAVVEAVWRPSVLYTTPFGYGLVDLVELDVATGATRTIFDAMSLQWISVSPTDRIFYADFRHDTFLFLVDVRTGERRQLTSHTSNNFRPTFSPDGRTLAYASSRTGDVEVWLHDLENGDETRVTDSEGFDVIADWSPEGRRLLLLSERGDGRLRPWVASADGAGGVRMLVDQPLNWQGPFTPIVADTHWSPDGAAIGYVVTEGSGGELWTVAPDGQGAARRVAGITGFVWYGDSRRVLVTRLRGSEKELVAVHLETGEERVLYTGALRELHLARDGSAVAFCFGRGH
jgi:Tol biopolymer transport system component